MCHLSSPYLQHDFISLIRPTQLPLEHVMKLIHGAISHKSGETHLPSRFHPLQLDGVQIIITIFTLDILPLLKIFYLNQTFTRLLFLQRILTSLGMTIASITLISKVQMDPAIIEIMGGKNFKWNIVVYDYVYSIDIWKTRELHSLLDWVHGVSIMNIVWRW